MYRFQFVNLVIHSLQLSWYNHECQRWSHLQSGVLAPSSVEYGVVALLKWKYWIKVVGSSKFFASLQWPDYLVFTLTMMLEIIFYSLEGIWMCNYYSWDMLSHIGEGSKSFWMWGQRGQSASYTICISLLQEECLYCHFSRALYVNDEVCHVYSDSAYGHLALEIGSHVTSLRHAKPRRLFLQHAHVKQLDITKFTSAQCLESNKNFTQVQQSQSIFLQLMNITNIHKGWNTLTLKACMVISPNK